MKKELLPNSYLVKVNYKLNFQLEFLGKIFLSLLSSNVVARK